MKERVRWRSELMETFEDVVGTCDRKVANSLLFVGRHGYASKKRVPYSFVRIDVQDGRPPKFIIRPFITEQVQREWYNHHLKPVAIGA